MRDATYVLFNAKGITGFRKNKPALRSGEYAVLFRLEVADAFFRRTTPAIDVAISEDAEMVAAPPVAAETDPGVFVGVEPVPAPAASAPSEGADTPKRKGHAREWEAGL